MDCIYSTKHSHTYTLRVVDKVREKEVTEVCFIIFLMKIDAQFISIAIWNLLCAHPMDMGWMPIQIQVTTKAGVSAEEGNPSENLE